MYVCMRACSKSFLKTTTNSLCACAHLANKADSDSDSDTQLESSGTFIMPHSTASASSGHAYVR